MSNVTRTKHSVVLDADQEAVMIMYLVVCPLGIFGNAAVAWLILRNEKLRQNGSRLQAVLAVSDLVLCVGQLSNAAWIFYLSDSAPIQRWACLVLSIPAAGASIFSLMTTAFMTLDRCYAVAFPIAYRLVSKTKICACCAITSGVVSAAGAIAPFTDVDLFDYPIGCLGAGSRSAKLNDLINYTTMILGFVILIVYVLIWTVVGYKIRVARDACIQFRKQLRISSSVFILLASGLVLYILPNLLVFILNASNVQPPQVLRYVVGACLIVHATMNFFIYLWKEQPLRQAFFKTYACKQYSISKPEVAPQI